MIVQQRRNTYRAMSAQSIPSVADTYFFNELRRELGATMAGNWLQTTTTLARYERDAVSAAASSIRIKSKTLGCLRRQRVWSCNSPPALHSRSLSSSSVDSCASTVQHNESAPVPAATGKHQPRVHVVSAACTENETHCNSELEGLRFQPRTWSSSAVMRLSGKMGVKAGLLYTDAAHTLLDGIEDTCDEGSETV